MLDSHDGLHSEVLLHCLSLLLQLVPALAEPGASGGSLQALPLLTTLIEVGSELGSGEWQVLGQLIESMMMSEEARVAVGRESLGFFGSGQRAAAAAEPGASARFLCSRLAQVAQVARWADLIQVAQDVKMEADGPTPGWPARVASGGGQHFGGLQILQTPEDALIRESSETQAGLEGRLGWPSVRRRSWMRSYIVASAAWSATKDMWDVRSSRIRVTSSWAPPVARSLRSRNRPC